MKWRERRQLSRSLERRVLAGERKADIVGQAAVDGEDWQAVARALALIPTPARRRRYLWLNRALLGFLALAATGEVAAAFSYDDRSIWLLLDLAFPALFLVALWGVVRFRARGYALAAYLAVIRLVWWAVSVPVHHLVSVPVALLVAQATVCAVVIVLVLAAQRRLLPETRTWNDMKPKTDAAGNLLFEE
jgi:hypothetical protein